MSSTISRRLAGAFGLLSVIGTFAGLIIHSYPDIGASGPQIARWAATTNQHQFAVGIYVEAVGILFFLGFAAWFLSAARDGEAGSRLLAIAGFSAAALYVLLGVVSNSVWWAVLDGGKRGTSPQTLAIVRDVAQHTFDSSNICCGLFLVFTGYVLITGRALPRAFGGAAVVLGIGLLVPQAVQLVMIPEFAWVVAVSIYLLVRPAAAAVSEPGVVMSARAVSTS